MELAIFDLDNTLIGGDSDSLWTDFLVELGVIGAAERELSWRFYRDYEQGRLDMAEFLAFQLKPLSENDPTTLAAWRERFVDEKIRPILLPKAAELVEGHRKAGRTLLIITATNRFITEPIARLYGINQLLATEAEMVDGRYTGRPTGVPCYREGKISRLNSWLQQRDAAPRATWFYSDSQNDIPLLEKVSHPAAVDPDPVLAAHARRLGWEILSLR